MPATYTQLLYHLVFSTKYRQPLITTAIQPNLYAYIGGIVRGEGGTLLEIGGMPDHVHLMIRSKPSKSISDLLRLIKGNSSKWFNEQHSQQEFHWQDGYSAFSVSESQLLAVRNYIRKQEEHHRGYDFQDELRLLLQKHAIEYDERWMWD